jgi:GTPase KRas
MEEGIELKIAMIGDGGIGKTSIVYIFINQKNVQDLDPTIEDSFRKKIIVENQTFYLEIFDTAGSEEYGTHLDEHILQNKAFVLVYSMTNKNSFEEITQHFKRICKVVLLS